MLGAKKIETLLNINIIQSSGRLYGKFSLFRRQTSPTNKVISSIYSSSSPMPFLDMFLIIVIE